MHWSADSSSESRATVASCSALPSGRTSSLGGSSCFVTVIPTIEASRAVNPRVATSRPWLPRSTVQRTPREACEVRDHQCGATSSTGSQSPNNRYDAPSMITLSGAAISQSRCPGQQPRHIVGNGAPHRRLIIDPQGGEQVLLQQNTRTRRAPLGRAGRRAGRRRRQRSTRPGPGRHQARPTVSCTRRYGSISVGPAFRRRRSRRLQRPSSVDCVERNLGVRPGRERPRTSRRSRPASRRAALERLQPGGWRVGQVAGPVVVAGEGSGDGGLDQTLDAEGVLGPEHSRPEGASRACRRARASAQVSFDGVGTDEPSRPSSATITSYVKSSAREAVEGTAEDLEPLVVRRGFAAISSASGAERTRTSTEVTRAATCGDQVDGVRTGDQDGVAGLKGGGQECCAAVRRPRGGRRPGADRTS